MTGGDRTPPGLMNDRHLSFTAENVQNPRREERTGSVPQTKLHELVIDGEIMDKVLEHRWFARENVGFSRENGVG